MRHFAAIIMTLLFMTFFVALPRFARSAGGEAVVENNDVKVSLAVNEGPLSTQSTLHVIIENISKKPQNHFEERYSWGYGNLSLQWTDAQGKTGAVTRVPRGWNKNFPATVVLQPGEALVREISFDPKLWEGWPAIKGQTLLTVMVTYRATGKPAMPNVVGWIGTVTSKEQPITIWRPAAPISARISADSPKAEVCR